MGLRRLINKEQGDVVIGFADMPNIVCYGALLAISECPSFIATIHSDLQLRDIHVGLSWKTRLLKSLHKRACFRADKVVVVSEGARSSLIDYYQLPTATVTRIYNPVLNTVEVANHRAEIALPLKLVAAGRLTQAKNYPIMIRAVQLLAEKYETPSHLSIYGEGELRAQLQELIDQLGLTSAITLHGFVHDLTAALAENDVFLMSSSWEGFGNVLVEALEANLRIVSTDCPSGPREILAEGKFGILVPVNDAERLAVSIIEASERPAMQNHFEIEQPSKAQGS